MNSRLKSRRVKLPKFGVIPPKWAVNYRSFLKTYADELLELEQHGGGTFTELLRVKTVPKENALKFELIRLRKMREEFARDPRNANYARFLTPKVLLELAKRNIKTAYGKRN